MGSEKKRKALVIWFLSIWYVSQQAVITPAMSRSLEGGTADEKNYYAPDPHGGSKRLFRMLNESMEAMSCMLHQTLVDLRGADSHGAPCTTPPSTHGTPLPRLMVVVVVVAVVVTTTHLPHRPSPPLSLLRCLSPPSLHRHTK
ncbi:unnamed protein product [Musa textilis]